LIQNHYQQYGSYKSVHKKNEEEEAALIHAYKMKIRTLPIK
jgi:hypothetical protein